MQDVSIKYVQKVSAVRQEWPRHILIMPWLYTITNDYEYEFRFDQI